MEKLDRVRPGNSILAQPEVQQLLRSGDGYKKSFLGMNLHGANLMGTDLKQANLKYADLSEAVLTQANLEGANLTETNAVGADLTDAWLTGACLAAWNIDSTTKLDKVDCRYVFLLEYPNHKGSRERRPHDPEKDFEPGDFAKLYTEIMNTVQILLRNGVNKEAFYTAFQNLIQEQPDARLKGIEAKGEDVLVTLEVPEESDKGQIERQFLETYELRLEAAKTQGRLEATEQHNQDLKDIILQTVTEKQDKQTIIQNIQQQGEIDMTENKGNVSISGEGNKISGVAAAGENQTITGSALGEVSGTVTIAINQLPETPEEAQPNLKELLTQLQTAIEADPNLDDDDKTEILKQVQVLAEAGSQPKDGAMKKTAKRATVMLTGLITGLSSAATLVTQWQEILPLIQGFFDF